MEWMQNKKSNKEMTSQQDKDNPKLLNTYKKIREVKNGTKVKATIPEKTKTTYPEGTSFQTDDLYGETIIVRKKTEIEGIVDETEHIRGVRTSDGKLHSFKQLTNIEIL